MTTTKNDALPIPCTRCNGACKVLACDPLVRGYRCDCSRRCIAIDCALCVGLGYQGCRDCGRPCTSNESQEWKDSYGEYRCAECASDCEVTQELRAIDWDPEPTEPDPIAYYVPPKSTINDSQRTAVDLRAVQ